MKNASVFTGRFQPFTKGHSLAVKNMMLSSPDCFPIIAIVKGKKSSLDKNRNPFNEKLQRLMILSSLGSLGITDENIIVIPSAFILEIIKSLEVKNLKLKTIYAGGEGDDDNRLKSYEGLVNKAKMPGTQTLIKDYYELDIEFKDTMVGGKRLENISGTDIRRALAKNDFKVFEKGTGFDKNLFKLLKKEV